MWCRPASWAEPGGLLGVTYLESYPRLSEPVRPQESFAQPDCGARPLQTPWPSHTGLGAASQPDQARPASLPGMGCSLSGMLFPSPRLKMCAFPSILQGSAHPASPSLVPSWVTLFFFCLFAISWAAPVAYGRSQARGRIGAVAASLHHSHSHAGSKPRPQPTPQPTAMPDPQPTEQGQGSNPQPHGS